MNTFLIGYDLNKQGQDYTTLIEKIKELGIWWHCLDSTWLVKLNSTSVLIRNYLSQFIDANDELLVIDITGDIWASTGFTEDCSSWLNSNI